ncbi:hypothetical protein CEXT_796691 [Caerostris extrusa]|uniref:Uncharacterized protein n=1 Tax=Caerostris extrusa TaxID=172846 RepID=A0AAV4QHG0_CAEEX|nr:hypothetical protein CEXT_796691 [Caerostris extrusa]
MTRTNPSKVTPESSIPRQPETAVHTLIQKRHPACHMLKEPWCIPDATPNGAAFHLPTRFIYPMQAAIVQILLPLAVTCWAGNGPSVLTLLDKTSSVPVGKGVQVKNTLSCKKSFHLSEK